MVSARLGHFMTKIVFELLSKKFILRMLGLITVQQILVASGTAALAMAGKFINTPRLFLLSLVGYCLLSLLPHFLTIYIRKIEMQGYFAAYYNYIGHRLLKLKGHSHLWPNHSQKEGFQTAIGPEAENYLTAVAFSIFDIYLYVLTIVLNIIAISWVVDSQFVGAFAAAALFSYGTFHFFAPSVDKIISKEQEQKMAFLEYLLKAWDNVLLKNTSISKRYIQSLEEKFLSTHHVIGHAHFRTELLVFILTIISSIPVFALLIHLAWNNASNNAYLAAMMITVPKQLSILSNFRAFYQQVTNLSSFTTRFKSYWDASALKGESLLDRIDFGKIKVNNMPVNSLESLLTKVNMTPTGRYLISGQNGAGKSSLLIHLNDTLSESMYLPPNPNFEIGGVSGSSTGEKILEHLEYIRRAPPPVILLDEWDANLDHHNQDALNRQIDLLALSCVVIEVRHRI